MRVRKGLDLEFREGMNNQYSKLICFLPKEK